MVKAFNSSIVNLEVKDSIINMVPEYFRTNKNNMFFNSSINELFRKGTGIQLKGYVGSKPDWYDPTSDFYISEMNNDRKYYQLDQTMVSLDDNQNYTTATHFSDYIKNLDVNGANIQNQNRLFEQEYNTWCPPINLDMFINYRLYYWIDSSTADYMVIDSTSSDQSPWSLNNKWKHISDISDSDKTTYSKALRPIVCFIPNIELYQYGTYRRHYVNYYDPSITDISTFLADKTSVVIDGVTINETVLENSPVYILVKDDTDISMNNKIYELVWLFGKIYFQAVTDGNDPSGSPTSGEITKVLNGTYANTEFYYDGISWEVAQAKTSVNQAPLFNLYSYNYDPSTDTEGYTSLIDTNTYPNNNFKGNKIFSYSIDPDEYYSIDPILGIYINQDSSGNVLFENYLITDTYQYIVNLISYDITGLSFFKVIGDEDYYSNNWYKKDNLSRQNMVDEYTYDGINNVFAISQNPENDNDIEVTVSTKSTDNVSNIVTKTLTNNIDYIYVDKTVVIYSLNFDDIVKIVTYNPATPSNDYNGYYELPNSLTANCTYQKLTTMSLGDIFQQFSDIMQNQTNFEGNIYNINNYRTLTPDFSKGNTIVETSSSMLLNMALVSNENLNLNSAYRYAADQYRIYKFKFINKITELYQTGIKNDNSEPTQWVEDALFDMTKGDTYFSPFYKSGVGIVEQFNIDHFIPPTPAFLGLMNPVVPYIDYDYSSPSKPKIICGHDGSIILAYNDVRDDVILAYETRIYNSIPYKFKKQTYQPFNIYEYINNGFNTNREYSITEWNEILEQNFLYWTANHNIDYRINNTYDATNPFTWNWSSVISNVDGSYLPGGWRGIYNYYYGTDAPHYKPWEMLGFDTKPDYWENYYGQSPYTNTNKMMWRDIENGIIAAGGNAGTYDILARPGLSNYIPVDDQGYLLDPYQAGIAQNYPIDSKAQNSWNFGDISPIENVWRRTSEYRFAVQLASYLAKPSMYIAQNWDTYNIKIVNQGQISEQWINTKTMDRPVFSKYTVHGETIDGNFIYNYGMQPFLSNYIISKSLNVTTELGSLIRGLDVRLSHRFAGFVDSDNMIVTSDSYGVIPSENTSVVLYESPSNENIFYSGMLIIKQTGGWKVYGYDAINPYFKIYNVDETSKGYSISVENVVNGIIPEWQTRSFYPKDYVVMYNGKKYISLVDHSSTSFFEISKWQQQSTTTITNKNSVTWYSNLQNNVISYIPYGTVITTYQDMCNLLNGLQNYYESVGLRFDQTSNISWSDIMKSFMEWDLSSTDQQYITYSPLSGNVTINNDFGNIENIFNSYDNFYGIIDASGKNIREANVRVVRSQSYTAVVPTDSVNIGIYGCRFYKNSIEHMLLVDNETVFGDILNSPRYNTRQARLRIDTFKTSDWTGRMIAPGFIVSGNTILPNFDTTADNFRHFYDVEETFYNELQERTRLNIGYFDKEYFDNMLITSTNQFEFYQGMIQHKGTRAVVNRLMRSNYVSNNRNLAFSEEWAFRVGTFGADSIDKNFDLYITQDDFSNDPQLFEFNTQNIINDREYNNTITSTNYEINLNDLSHITTGSTSYTGNVEITSINLLINSGSTGIINLYSSDTKFITNYDISNGSISLNCNTIQDVSENITLTSTVETSITVYIQFKLQVVEDFTNNTNHIVINDVRGNNGKFVYKDSRWAWRLFGDSINFPTQQYNLNDPSFLPTAGYVSLDTIQWTATDLDTFKTLYSDTLIDNPKTTLSKTYDFNLTGEPQVYTIPLIKGNNGGYYRVNEITYNVTKSFSYNIPFTIGTSYQLPSDPETNNFSETAIYRLVAGATTTIQKDTVYPSSIISLDNDLDNTIYLQVDCSKITTIPSNISLGKVSITINVEWVKNSIMSGDRVWLYDNGIGDWGTYKLYDTTYKIKDITETSNGNPLVSLPISYTTDNNITLSNVIGNNSIIQMDGIQGTTQYTQIYKPLYDNSITTVIDTSKNTNELVNINNDAGMKLSSMTINILQPFSTSDGSELDIKIGTTDNESLLADSSVISNPIPTTPTFDSSSPVTVQVANQTISYLTNTTNATVYVTRSGNIFNIPNQCDDIPDTTFTWSVYGLNTDGTVNTSNQLDSGSVTFGNPDDTTASKESYWLQSVNISISNVDSLAFVITAVSGNGSVSTSNTTFITISGTSTSYVLFDPTQAGVQSISVDLLNLTTVDGPLNFIMGNNTTGSAYITIEYTYSNGFELQTIEGDDITFDTTGYGGNIYLWVPTRFANVSAFNSSFYNSFAYNNNDYIEIDNINNLWNITQYNNKTLVPYIIQSEQINSNLIENAVIYNNKTNITEQTLELFDPLKGYIPGVAKQYLGYIIPYDPARYTSSNVGATTSNDSWGSDKVGNLWWDTSTAKYVDYEIGDYSYKWKNWGKIAPGSSIDIYEWVKSPVLPSSWNSYVSSKKYASGFSTNPSGTVDDIITTYWTEETEYDDNKNIEVSIYYFWVKLPTTCDEYAKRQVTATQISSIISNPYNAGIPYFSVIDSNKIIVGGIKQFLDDKNTVLKVNWKTMDSDNNYHKQWELIKENDDSTLIDSKFWNKMTDSLVGYKSTEDTSSLSFTSLTDVYQTSDTITLSGNTEDFINIPYSGEFKISKYWITYSGVNGNTLLNVANETGEYFKKGQTIKINQTSYTNIAVPDPSLTSFEMIGTNERPLQSWFAPIEISSGNYIPSRDARKICIYEINSLLSQAPYLDQWYDATTLLTSQESAPASSQYKFTATDFDYRDSYIKNGINVFDRIFVEGNDKTNGFWTLWEYRPFDYNCDYAGFVLVQSQTWRLRDGELWTSIDWYADGYDSSDYPQYTFNSKADRDANAYVIDNTLLNGTLVQINSQDSSDTRWSWSVLQNGTWIEVAKEKSTIQLSSNFYTSDVVYGFGNYVFDDILTRDGSIELGILLGYFYNDLMSKIQINDLFFSMVKGALSLNFYNDWVFKTSYMYIGGCYEQLKQMPTIETNTIDNIIEYIENVKPYHVKIRDYISTYTIGPDNANVHVTDFDFPTSNGTILKPQVDGELNYNNTGSNSIDTATVQTNYPWKDWYDNYNKTNYDSSNWDDNWNPVRHMKVTMKFDRIACSVENGWDSGPWDASYINYDQENSQGLDFSTLEQQYRGDYKNYGDFGIQSTSLLMSMSTENVITGCVAYVINSLAYYMWTGTKWIPIEVIGWDSDTSRQGAIDRINEFYEPSGSMIQKDDIANLMRGCGYEGVSVDGDTIEQGLSFMYPWDYYSGFDNQKGYYVGGTDPDSIINTNSSSQISGTNPAIKLDDRGRDIDITSNPLGSTNTVKPNDIDIIGNNTDEPEYSMKTPEELCNIKVFDSLVIKVTDNIGTDKTSFILSKNNFGKTDLINMDNSSTVISDDVTSITIAPVNGEFPFHDPANPSQSYLDIVKSTYVDMTKSTDDENNILGRLNPGIIWINGEKVIYWTVTKSGDNYIISDLIRGYGVTSQKTNNAGYNELSTIKTASVNDVIYDGSILSWVTYDYNPKFTITDNKYYMGNIRFI